MSSEFRLGPWLVQPSQNTISCNGKTTRLEPKMVEVLVCLAERPAETVSKEQLMRNVWGDTFVTEDVLTRCISELRKALQDDVKDPHVIQTIPRKGYRLVLRAEPVEQIKKKNLRRYLMAAVVLCLALGLAITYARFRHPPPPIRSLAVLPLRNLSGDPDQEYFVDGLTDELTADLAKLGTLRVISRSSAMLYRDTPKPSPQVARELNVDAVVTGTVERSDSRVRVRTKLVRAATDEVLWAENYDRDLGDVLRLEGEVAQAIAHEVGIKLTPQAQHRLEHKPTTNPEARDAYLRARYFCDKDDKEGATKCLQYFQEAIAKDPGYAAAYAGLSRCIDLGTIFDLMSEPEAAPKIKAAAIKAVELDDGLGEGHSELADYYLARAWDFSAAAREFERAIELDPNSSAAHRSYAYYFRDLGRTDKAVQEMQRARELDPLSLQVADDLAWMLAYSRRYDEAVAQFHSVLEMDPNFRRARWGLARVYELKGMYKEAISECLKIPALPNIDPFAKALFERRCSLYEKVYTTSGAERVNRRWFESARQEIKDAINRDDDPYSIATLYAASGADEKALDLLERSYAQHDSALLQLKVDPRMDSLRSNPRFQALLRRMNFPE
jgi:TolB-like protein/DNA-binding winged helix-turn-helix (wHTH) protein